ncbi:MAG: hypothetical protein E7B88_01805, partial [Finegoldia magna]|nr:hypothetical protein [Finegoldia magna]
MKYVFLLSSKAGAGSFSELEHSIVKCYSSNNLKYTIMSCVSSLILIIFVIGDLPSGIMMSQNMILGMVIAYF